MMIRRLQSLILQIVLVAVMAAPLGAQNAAFQRIENLEFRESSVGDAIRLISRLSSVNIFATREAANREFSMSVKDATVKGVVASIARVTGLSYSYDEEASALMLMTNKQFAGDVVITRSAQTKVFNLRHQNVVSAARVVESLFGDRVSLNINTEDPERLQISDGAVQTTRTVARNQSSSSASGGASSGDNLNAVHLDPGHLQRIVGANAENQVLKMSDVVQQFGLEPKIYITINRQHNLLYVRTTDREAMIDIEKIIRDTDRPTKQVLLEVRIMSLNLDDNFRSTFNFGLNGGSDQTYTSTDGSTVTGRNGVDTGGFSSDGGGLFFQFLSDNLKAQIDLLEQDNRAKTLSTPMLSASNNTPARLFVGTEAVLARGFSSNTTTGSTGATTTTSQTDIELREVGQSLEILPRINADDTVTLVIQQENSTVITDGGQIPVISNNGSVSQVSIDTVNTARVGGTVTAKTGTTIAVGGLINDTTSNSSERTPILGNIPLLGLAFRGDSRTHNRSELILLITPHIYSGGIEGERKARQRLARLSRNSDVDNAGFSASTGGVPSVRLRGQQQKYANLTRFAAAMRHGIKPADKGAYRGIDTVEVSSGGGLKLTDQSEVSVEAVESWRQQNLYVTAVLLTNTGSKPSKINVNTLKGDWLTATLESQKLAARGQGGSRTYLYLISDRPYDAVIETLRAGGGL